MSVFISGANGYIAKHIISLLLEQDYKVIGTVRSQTKIDGLVRQFGNNPNLKLEIVEDISKLAAFDDVFKKHGKEIKFVLHTASPFFFDTTDVVNDLLIPAVNGTKSILNAIRKYASANVERVVITSSAAAILNLDRDGDSTFEITEESWNPDSWEYCQRNPVAAYCGSKKFAERAAWDFLKENKDQVKFNITTVNPVNVFGPQLFDDDVRDKMNTSCEMVNEFIHTPPNTKIEPLSMLNSFIDVRDVAKAHILAIQNDNLIGQRLMMHEGRFSAQDLLDVLNEDFSVLRGNIPVGEPHTGATHGASGAVYNNEKTRTLLGFKFKTLKETIDDTAAQILKHENRLI